MKKKLVAVLAASLLSVSALHAKADSYFGISYGVSDIDTGVSNLTGTANLDEDDSGFKVFYGFNVSPQFAVELHYADFGDATLEYSSSDTIDFNGTTYGFGTGSSVAIGGSSFGASGVLKMFEEGTFVPFAKLGVHRWAADVLSDDGATLFIGSDDGFDVNYGLGADINFSDSFAMRLEYEAFGLGDNTDAILASIGLNFKF